MDEARKYLEEEKSRLAQRLEETKKMLAEPGLAEMAADEVKGIEAEMAKIDEAIAGGQGTEETADGGESFKSVMIEARPGVGGDEAKIWADDLIRMYTRYAQTRGWRAETLDEGVIKISGKEVFEVLKYETGVHRVQRVPVTEAAGRIHTSTASIVVLPEVAENRIEVKEDDLIWEFTRGGGHGGQNVNKVATAVRLTHKPSGLVVQSRQERSQEQNRKIALALLRSQLWEIEEEKKMSDLADKRAAIGRSMRAEKIRTYNYPQNRVTDHRIGKSWHKLERIIEGDLTDVAEALAADLGNGHADGNNQAADDQDDGNGLTQPEE
jgi:peptide chain release factor 1